MVYPTIEEINSADRYQLCKWYRFLRCPENKEEVVMENQMFARWKDAGGFTPAISRAIGW